MNCERAFELLSVFYDQETKPDLRNAVRDHLEHCSDCTRQLGRFAELSKWAADLQQPEVPVGMWSAIASSLNAHRDRNRSKPVGGRHDGIAAC